MKSKNKNKSKTLKRVGNVTENRYASDAIKAYYPVYPFPDQFKFSFDKRKTLSKENLRN